MTEKVDRILMEMGFLDERPSDTMELKGDLGFDSLRMVELIVALEDACSAEIEESDLDPARLQTVADVRALFAKYAKEEICHAG